MNLCRNGHCSKILGKYKLINGNVIEIAIKDNHTIAIYLIFVAFVQNKYNNLINGVEFADKNVAWNVS